MAALCYPQWAFASGEQPLAKHRLSMPPSQACPLPCSHRALTARLLAAALCALALGLVGPDDQAWAKRKPKPVKEPDLKILSVALSPTPYAPQDGSLDLAIQVRLPKELPGSAILEVSSLISSPSMRSMRFLSKRQPVDPAGTPEERAAASDGQAASSPTPPQPGVDSRGSPAPGLVEVTLTWDGTDQMKQVVGQGEYHYEIRAKLLTADSNGVRTQMVSWPKRGVLKVK